MENKKKVIVGLGLIFLGGIAYWWFNKNKAVQVDALKKIVQQPRNPIASMQHANIVLTPPDVKQTLPINNPIQSGVTPIDIYSESGNINANPKFEQPIVELETLLNGDGKVNYIEEDKGYILKQQIN